MNQITAPIININPARPPSTPPIIAPLLTFFFSPLLAAAVALLLAVAEELELWVEERDVVGAVVVARWATVAVKACPTCPA